MALYKKKRPSVKQFSLIPRELWNEKKPIPALVLSRIVGGTAYSDKLWAEHPVHTLTVPAGTAWMSMETIREDITSAIGRVISRKQIRTAMNYLKERSLLASELAIPSTKGKYGLLLTPNLSQSTQSPTLDPVMEYKIHAYGDVSAFKYGGIANASPTLRWKQRQPGDVLSLIKNVAATGSQSALFRTVGVWRDRDDVRDPNQPVFLPWIVLDIDVAGHMVEAHETCLSILSDLEDAGLDSDRMFVSFSGSKGFHIAIATSQIGCPVFRDSDNARECLVRFVKTLTDHTFDPSTLSPLQMLRLTGSRHQKTGKYKKTWVASRFRTFQLHQVLSATDEFEPWQYPDPTVGDIEEEVQNQFELAAKEQAQQAWKIIQDTKKNPHKGYDTPGPGIVALLKGLKPGESWGNREGRDWAAFTLSCFCFTHPKQHEMVRRTLKIHGEFDTSFNSVHETLTEWNALNSPPLSKKDILRKTGAGERHVQKRKR